MTLTNEQVKLQEWLEDYALYRGLQSEKALELKKGEPLDFSKEPSPTEGQIRLWPALGLDVAPLYGVLMSAGYALWRVFPFSELAHPAIPQEWKLRDEAPARVLEGWNAREIAHSMAAQSWCVDRITDEEFFKVKRWWLELSAGEVHFREENGPALRHPLDPRHDYLEQEVCRANICIGEPVVGYEIENELKKAAEPESDYGKKSENDASE